MVDVVVVERMVLRKGRGVRGFDLDEKTLRVCNEDRKGGGWKGGNIYGQCRSISICIPCRCRATSRKTRERHTRKMYASRYMALICFIL